MPVPKLLTGDRHKLNTVAYLLWAGGKITFLSDTRVDYFFEKWIILVRKQGRMDNGQVTECLLSRVYLDLCMSLLGLPEAGRPKPHRFIFSRFWRLEVHGEVVSKFGFF